jgi:GNAT superfamily N-acetyltransferase
VTKPVEVPLPEMPGIRFRYMDHPADDARLSALLNAGLAADGLSWRLTPEEITSWLDHPSNLDPSRDILLAEADGELVANSEAGWEEDNDGGHNYSTWGQVLPAWRRRGIGTALLHWTEARQRAVAATHPAAVEKRMQSWTQEAEVGRHALLEANGYTVARYDFEMERATLDDLPTFPLPDGVQFRPAREEDLRVHFDLEVAVFRDHWGAIDGSDASFERMRADPRRDIGLWVAAWHGDQLVGQSLNRINAIANAELGRKQGWVNSVGVRRDWRRRGIARALVAESLRVLRDAGMTSAALGVDADNPHGALGVYEACGFVVARRGRVYRKPLAG